MTTGTTTEAKDSPLRTKTLGQIVALVSGAKTRAARGITDAYQAMQKPAPMHGISRSYQPRDDEGESLPSESTRVQVRAAEAVAAVREQSERLINLVATQDWANCEARGDIVVDGRLIAAQVPATHLMWLEKHLVDLRTFIGKLPTLDPAETWHWDDNAQAWATEPMLTTRTKKVPRNHVKAEATDRHPAQVDVWMEDIVVGDWRTIRYSGALPAATVRTYAERIEQLHDAVKAALQTCNTITAPDIALGGPLLNFVFGT